VCELTGGGAPAVLECVGTVESFNTAIHAARAGGTVGHVGVPGEAGEIDLFDLHMRNVALVGGVAPVRAYLPELVADVLAGRLDPSPVIDATVGLEDVAEGYAAMDERRAIKTMLRVA